MKSYRFARTVVCAGTKRTDGEIVTADMIPDGSLEPMLRTGMITEHIEPAAEVAEPEPAKKKSKADKE